jgi:Fur family iron response transcriptional regulator
VPLDVVAALRTAGIQLSAQRVAVARYVLDTDEHPSADQVWARVRDGCPVLSRATVYNTLNLLEAKGLVRRHVQAEGRVVFDPNVERHHHLIDESGRIHDIPWDTVRVSRVGAIDGFDVQEYQVVMRGRRLGRRRSSARSRHPAT